MAPPGLGSEPSIILPRALLFLLSSHFLLRFPTSSKSEGEFSFEGCYWFGGGLAWCYRLGHPAVAQVSVAVMQVTFAVVLLKLALRRRGLFVGPPGEGSSFVDHCRLSLCWLFIINISTAVCSCHSCYVR